MLGIDGFPFPVYGVNWVAKIVYVLERAEDDRLEYKIAFQPDSSTDQKVHLNLLVFASTLIIEKDKDKNKQASGVIAAIIGWLHGDKSEFTLNYDAMKSSTQE